jgi:methylated-DNA-protein-cysteine methyltransferase-like protein
VRQPDHSNPDIGNKVRTNTKLNKPKNDDDDRRTRVAACIRALPRGTVSSYGAIAKAVGWPGAARQVVRILQQTRGLPWHRVVGAGGVIKLGGENAAEQRFRLRLEGVAFRGMRVDMKRHEYKFPKKSAKGRL